MVASALLFASMAATVGVRTRASCPTRRSCSSATSSCSPFLVPWLLSAGAPRALDTDDLRGHLVRGPGRRLGRGLLLLRDRAPAARRRGASSTSRCRSSSRSSSGAGSASAIPPRAVGRARRSGFAGLLVILRPGTGVFEPAALVGLASAVLASIAQVGIRRLTRTEPVTRIVFYFGLVGSVVALPAGRALGGRPPRPATWAVLLLMGVFATVGQLTPDPRLRARAGRARGTVPLRRARVRGAPRLAPLGPPARRAVRAGGRGRGGRGDARPAPARRAQAPLPAA